MFAKESWTVVFHSCALKCLLRGAFPAKTLFSSLSSAKYLVEDFLFFFLTEITKLFFVNQSERHQNKQKVKNPKQSNPTILNLKYFLHSHNF